MPDVPGILVGLPVRLAVFLFFFCFFFRGGVNSKCWGLAYVT